MPLRKLLTRNTAHMYMLKHQEGEYELQVLTLASSKIREVAPPSKQGTSKITRTSKIDNATKLKTHSILEFTRQ
mgnify:CR=1 FL=1